MSTITATDFDNWDATFIRTTVELAAGLDIGAWEYVERWEEADVELINVTGGRGGSRRVRPKKQVANGRPLVVHCVDDATDADAHQPVLARPLTYSALVSLLVNLEGELRGSRRTGWDRVADGAGDKPIKPDRNSPAVAAEQDATQVTPLTADRPKEIDLTASINAKSAADQCIPDGMGPMSDKDSLIETYSLDRAREGGLQTATVISDWLDEAASEDGVTANGQGVESTVRSDEGEGTREGSNLSIDPAPTIEKRSAHLAELTQRLEDVPRLLEILRGAVASGELTEIVHQRYSPIRVDPARRLYASPTEGSFDADMFRAPVSEFEVCQVPPHQSQGFAAEWQTRPLWTMLYMAALYGSEGRLKRSASFEDRLHLYAKPDFERVPSTPEHQRVASYLLGETADVLTIAAATGVPLATVIDFANACDEVQLLESESSSEGPKVDQDANSSPPRERQRGRWQRLKTLLHRGK